TFITDNKSDFLRELFSITNQEVFLKSGAYDPESKYYLFTTNTTAPTPGIKESKKDGELVYEKFVKISIDKILEKHGEELTKKFILPLFKKKEETPAPGAEATNEEGGEQPKVEEDIVLANPVSTEEFKNKLAESILEKVTRYFLTEFSLKKNNDFSKYSHRIEERFFDPILESIKNEIDRRIISNFTIDDQDRNELVQQELFALDTFDQKIFEAKWYEVLLEQSSEYIQQLPSPDSQYKSYLDYLYEQYISPALVIIEEETPEQAEAEEAVIVTESQATPISGAVVPTNIPVAPTTPGVIGQVSDVSQLTQEETRQLQYESAWLYNRAIYELYTSQGKDPSDRQYAAEIGNLQANIFKYINSMRVDNADDFNKLFGNAVQRQKTLLEFYQKNKILITRFQDADELLRKSLKENVKLDGPVLTQNIKNTIDSLIIQYGINQTYFAFDPETNLVTEFSGNIQHDVLWFIDTIPIERLVLIFNIQESVLKNDEAVLFALKKILKEYAKYRGSELTLHIKNTSLQKGLIQVSAADAQKIKNGDQETIKKHLVFINDIRDMTKKHDGETVAGALDEKKDSNRKDAVRKQFKTFIPLWTQLNPDEQALVYLETLGYIPKDNPDYSVIGYPFIPEFIFFDLSKLRSVARISQDKNLSEKEKGELLEILAINEQLAKEQALSDFLNDSYNFFSDESEVRAITEYLGAENSNISFRERVTADQEIQVGGDTEYEPAEGGRGLVSRISNSKFGKNIKQRFGKRFKKKVDPIEKSKKAFRTAASNTLNKIAVAGSNLILPGSGVLLAAIPSKTIRDGVSGLIVGAITAIIATTVSALGSIGGLIGGFLGGAAGFILGGPAAIIPGVIVGANVGQAIIPQRWTGVFSGNNSSSQVSAVQQTTTGVATINNASLLEISTANTALLTVGITTAFALASTFLTIFIIQSAFLIPVPKSNLSVGFDPTAPVGGIG
ncbi:hypothetical protein KA017_03970, partial [Candidatus Woesebacteria bacterium]|nr:hypothetical protein [Candidatus Woesebacteria bacterium]